MGFFSKIKKALSRPINDFLNPLDKFKDAIDWVKELINPEEPKPAAAADTTSGLTVNKSSATEKPPKIYGKRKLGGTRVYLSTSGNKNAYLNSVLVQCIGPVHSSSSVTVSDKAESTFGNALRYTFHAGYPSQAADANFVSELSDWTTNHRLQGFSYQAVRYTYDQDKYSGLPVFNSIIEGALLYDPRDESTAYSDNFSLAVLDYFRSTEYGVGIPDNLIDFESFKTAANLADVSYPSNSDSDVMVRRFACNVAIDTGKTPFDNIKQLVSESRAFLTQTAGQWRYVIQNDSTPDHAVTYDDIEGDISRSPNGARDKYNRVTVSYVDPDKEWDTNEATYPIDDAEYQSYLEEDNWEESHADITVDSCTNRYQALDIARQALLESRIGGAIAFTGQPWMIKVRCGDLLVMDVPGLRDGTLWRVASRKITADGEISFTCAAYDPSIFPWIDLPDQPVITPPTVADSSILPAPEALSYLSDEWDDSTVGALIWSQSNSAYVHDYVIEIYRVSDSVQVLSTSLISSAGWLDDYMPRINLPYLGQGEYIAMVRARNALTRSEPTSITFGVYVPTLPLIAGLAQSGEFDADLTLNWAPVVSKNAFRFYRVEIIVGSTSVLYLSSITESITITNAHFETIGFPRSFKVHVSAVNVAFSSGAAASLTINRSLPATPVIEMIPSVDNIKLSLSSSANRRGTVVWVSTSDPIVMTDVNQKYKGESLSITLDGLLPLTRYYLAVAAYDAFGVGYAVYYSVTTLKDSIGDTINNLSTLDLTQEVSNLDESALLVSLRTGKNQRDILSIKQALSGAGII